MNKGHKPAIASQPASICRANFLKHRRYSQNKPTKHFVVRSFQQYSNHSNKFFNLINIVSIKTMNNMLHAPTSEVLL